MCSLWPFEWCSVLSRVIELRYFKEESWLPISDERVEMARDLPGIVLQVALLVSWANWRLYTCGPEWSPLSKLPPPSLPSLPPSDQTTATKEAHLFTAFNWYRRALGTECRGFSALQNACKAQQPEGCHPLGHHRLFKSHNQSGQGSHIVSFK